jgi:hypothetical protein
LAVEVPPLLRQRHHQLSSRLIHSNLNLASVAPSGGDLDLEAVHRWRRDHDDLMNIQHIDLDQLYRWVCFRCQLSHVCGINS